jgi:predicted RNase H-like nuclease (RuvC/YqgF family)
VAAKNEIIPEVPTTKNPFKLGRYIVQLIDIIQELQAENRQLRAQLKELQKKLEQFKKKLH